jgi:hypothetical protein
VRRGGDEGEGGASFWDWVVRAYETMAFLCRVGNTLGGCVPFWREHP